MAKVAKGVRLGDPEALLQCGLHAPIMGAPAIVTISDVQ